MNKATLHPGFADPVFDSQRVFRAILTALSEPGIVVNLGSLESPLPLQPALTACVLALADGDTPVWLDEASRQPGVPEYLQFHCGCPLVEAPQTAQFGVVTSPLTMPRLEDFATGSDERPDQSATLLIEVAAVSNDSIGWTLSGPGIPSSRTLAVAGLPDGFAAGLFDNYQRFPAGVDILLTCGSTLVGLPRTTRVRWEA